MPAAMPKIVSSAIKSLFRALHSMMCSIMVMLRGLRLAERLHRALQLCFRVDEKISARHDAFAFGHPAAHFVKLPKLHAEFDRARLKFASAAIDENKVARAGWQHCADRNSERVAH